MNKDNIMIDREVVKKIADFYGYKSQRDILIEELSELIKAVCKFDRSKDSKEYNKNYNNIIEEIADVLLMISQIIYLLDIDCQKLHSNIDYKIMRTLTRMEEVN